MKSKQAKYLKRIQNNDSRDDQEPLQQNGENAGVN